MKIVVLGAEGQLGREFVEYFQGRCVPVIGFSRNGCDITDPSAIDAVLASECPDVVINTAAYNQVDQAEDNPEKTFAVNAEGVQCLARRCAEENVRMVHFSTDYVFDGQKATPYVERDPAHPLSVYGHSKLLGERYVLASFPGNLVFRVSWVTGVGRQNFLFKLKEWLGQQAVVRVANDEISVPTFTFRIVQVVGLALERGLAGLYHLTSSGRASRYEWAREYLRLSGLSDQKVVPVPRSTFSLRAVRPAYSAMSSQALCEALFMTMPDWREDLKSYIETQRSKKGAE